MLSFSSINHVKCNQMNVLLLFVCIITIPHKIKEKTKIIIHEIDEPFGYIQISCIFSVDLDIINWHGYLAYTSHKKNNNSLNGMSHLEFDIGLKTCVCIARNIHYGIALNA
eukprot:311125_1